jgi:hypothetical protein
MAYTLCPRLFWLRLLLQCQRRADDGDGDRPAKSVNRSPHGCEKSRLRSHEASGRYQTKFYTFRRNPPPVPTAPSLSLAGVWLIIPDHALGFPCCARFLVYVLPPLPRCSDWA